MQLREMRYARIEGTEVLVEVRSAAEAKTAIKELKHKKKELALLKKRLQRQQTSARRSIAKAEADQEREARRRGVLATLRRISSAFRSRPALPNVRAIEQDLEHTDEILHNIESCIIQLEGRLIA